MRGWVLVLLILSLGIVPGWAQGALPPAEEGFLGFGGPQVVWVSPELSALNDALSAQGFPALPGGLIALGGGGGVWALRGLRWGAAGFGGELHARAGDRNARLRLGWGGLWLSYGLVADARFDLAVGTLVGGGGARLELTHRRVQGFEDAIAAPLSSVLTRGLFVLGPRIELGLVLMPWAALRLEGGFFYAFGDDWRARGVHLPGPPTNFSGWSASLRVEFGTREGVGP